MYSSFIAVLMSILPENKSTGKNFEIEVDLKTKIMKNEYTALARICISWGELFLINTRTMRASTLLRMS